MNLDIARVTQTANVLPFRCCLCTSGEAPILDTGIEFAGLGRVYFCKRCARDIARLFGFSRGKQLDQLMSAKDERDRFERQIEEMNEMIHDLTGALKTKDLMIRALEADKENLKSELAHLNLLAKNMKEAAQVVVNQ